MEKFGGDTLGEMRRAVAAHRRAGQRGHLRRAARLGGEQLDGLVLQQRGVDVHHDQPHGPPVQPAALHGHVDAEPDGFLRERRAQRHRVRAGDVEFDAGHRPVREPSDPVDVRPVGGDPAGDGREHGRRQRAAQDGDVQAAAAARRPLHGAHGDLHLHAQVGRQLGDLPVHRGEVGRGAAGQQDAEDQASPDNDLLHVEDAQLVGRQGGEKPGGDAWPVPAGSDIALPTLPTPAGERRRRGTRGTRRPGRPEHGPGPARLPGSEGVNFP